jgi:hypothetical protein
MRFSVPAWGEATRAAAAATAPLDVPGTESGTEPATPVPVPTQGATRVPAADPAFGPGEEPAGRWQRFREAFRAWRHSRPFWGGLLVVLGGAEILGTYRAPIKMVLHFGLYGLGGFLVPAMLVLLGALIVFDPQHRTFYSLLAVACALGTWLTSNLGGFIVGMLLGLVGGSLAFGWQVGERPARKRRRRVGAGVPG